MNFNQSMMRQWIVCLLLFVVPLSAQELSIAAKGEVAVGTHGMATTAHPLASMAAIEILQKGGNAIDAACAAAFAVGVVEPDGSGLGGGGAMLVYLAKTKKVTHINFYTESSARVNEVNYNPAADSRSAKAILIPGTVAGLTLALEKFGTLPLSVVLAPAIRYAEQGFPLDQTLSQIVLDNVEFLQKYQSTALLYLRDGFPLTEGDTLRQPQLAKTLRVVAEKGAAGFYSGEIAEAIAKGVQEQGGMLTVEDLNTFRAQILEPVYGTYRGYDIISAAPPQSGVSIIEALNMLENENLARLGHFSTSTDALHVMAESMRRMYADRTAYLDDPRTSKVPVLGLTSKDYARTRYDDINRAMADPREYRKTKAGNPSSFNDSSRRSAMVDAPEESPQGEIEDDDVSDGNAPSKKFEDPLFNNWGSKKKSADKKATQNKRSQQDSEKKEKQYDPEGKEQEAMILKDVMSGQSLAYEKSSGEGGHTTHLSVVDKDGNVVTLTQTLGTFFGSGLTIEGVLLNCAMSNFSTTLAINTIGPRTQPRSSIAPTILMKDGKPFLSVGSPGATRIEATIIELIVNIIDYGMDAGAANQAPRFFCQKNDDYLHLESRISAEVQEGLKKKGHQLRVYGDYDLFFGGAQLILVDQKDGKLYGSADPRRGGVAIGY